MLDALGLIEKHRGTGVLIDSNLLVLHLVGTVNWERLKTFKRTQAYTLEDFELLEGLISCLGRLFTTPHVLTEVSNLTGSLSGRELAEIDVYKRQHRILTARLTPSRSRVEWEFQLPPHRLHRSRRSAVRNPVPADESQR